MHSDLSPRGADAAPLAADTRSWYKTLNRYQWFVLFVAALGWMFDTMDQQLFNLARPMAMRDLVTTKQMEPSEARARVNKFGGYATSIFLIGWATGGLLFGILGDRIGRAKTMLLTILLYSLFTGLSALSTGFADFALYRFLTGLGVGGEFAVGVALVAEVMPDKARPFALGLLQGLSAIGNITAAVVSMILGPLEEAGTIGSAWRPMFFIGAGPALLCLLIFRKLREPERWLTLKAQLRERNEFRSAGEAPQKLGSLSELFGDPRWRKRALLGLLLSSSGIIGLWAIGFYSFDLNRSVFRKNFEAEARQEGQARLDLEFVRQVMERLAAGEDSETVRKALAIEPVDLLNTAAKMNNVQLLYKAVKELHKQGQPVGAEPVLAAIDDQLKGNPRRDMVLADVRQALSLPVERTEQLREHVKRINDRTKQIAGRLTLWAGITSVMLNLGAAFGIWGFTRLSQRSGRRPAFAIAYVLALVSTAWVFWTLDKPTDIFWMIPIMGFCQLSLFGGYAIYFPELFPTRLRSTGISFCYNVARYVAAAGPSLLGILSSQVFSEQKGFEEPLRYAGVTMCSVFLIGLCALPFAPETKGQPLPE